MAISNVQRLTRGDRKYAAKKQTKSVEEVKFDSESRNEFLTGFHKRKLARQAEGRRKAEELNRQTRLAERRRIREDRQKSIMMGMERLKEAENIIEGKTRVKLALDGPNTSSISGSKAAAEDDSEDGAANEEEFTGFEESSGILKRRDVAYGNSNVTFEEINLDPYVDIARSEEVLDEATRKAHEYAAYVASLEEQQRKAEEQARKVQKKKKFRYLPKAERKLMTRKNKAR